MSSVASSRSGTATPNRIERPGSQIVTGNVNDDDPSCYYEGLISVPRSQWIFTMKEFQEATPSRMAGVNIETELQRRFRGNQYLVKCCRDLKLSRAVGLTASDYLHRFYMRKDIERYNYFEIAATCLFIACKAEECRRKLSDVVKVCGRIASKQPGPLDEQSKLYWTWKDIIVAKEEKVLEQLCFEVTQTNPYKVCSEELDLANIPPSSQEEIISGTWNSRVRNVFGHAARLFELSSRVPLSVIHDPYIIAALGVVAGCKAERVVCPGSLIRERFSCELDDIWSCYEDLHTLTKYLEPLDGTVIKALPVMTREEMVKIINDQS